MTFSPVVLLGAVAAVDAPAPPWSFSAAYREDAAATVLGQTHQPSRYSLALGRRIGYASQVFWRHEYRVLDLPAVGGVAADSNGHVHRTAPGWRFDAQDRRIEIAPTVAVSSNALKDPKELRADDLRVTASIEQRAGEGWWLGLHADDRFGRSRVYPGFAFEFRPHSAHDLRIGFPDSAWRWRLAPSLQAELSAGPDGGRWQVRDQTLERRSDVRIRAWQAGWTLRWQPVTAFAAEARVGWRLATELRYALRDGTSARVDVPDGLYFRIGAELQL